MTRTATLTKKTPLEPLFPPEDIRHNTSARRQWLAEQLAALPAGVEGRITHSGSYQRISRWQVTEVAGRERFRGTCQFCGGKQVTDVEHGLVLHGYSRPGWGYVFGSCPGTKALAAEQSVAFTERVLADLELQLVDAKERAAALCHKHNVDHLYRVANYVQGDDAKAASLLSNQIFGMESHVSHLRRNVLTQLGKPLQREVVA